jgi:hypothetical protein
MWWMYFVLLYEYRTMKLVKVVLGRGAMRENYGGGESD